VTRALLVAWWFLAWGIGSGDPDSVGPYDTRLGCELGRLAYGMRYPRASTVPCFDGNAVQT
jgi:hypothetical protein